MANSITEFISVFARNCEVRPVSREQAKCFLEVNHRFGWSNCRHCYGLFVSKADRSGFKIGDMVAVSCFSNARRWEKGEKTISSYEWVRYASVRGVRVSGGMGKMLKHFIDEVKPDDIMSYAPLSAVLEDQQDGQQEGDVYQKLHFTEEGVKEFPNGKSLKYRLKITDY